MTTATTQPISRSAAAAVGIVLASSGFVGVRRRAWPADLFGAGQFPRGILVALAPLYRCCEPTERARSLPRPRQRLSDVGLSPREGQERFMGRKLFVGNLSYNTDERRLEEIFQAIGPVDS